MHQPLYWLLTMMVSPLSCGCMQVAARVWEMIGRARATIRLRQHGATAEREGTGVFVGLSLRARSRHTDEPVGIAGPGYLPNRFASSFGSAGLGPEGT